MEKEITNLKEKSKKKSKNSSFRNLSQSLEKDKINTISNAKRSSFMLLSECLIKHKGKLQLFKLADKLSLIRENVKNQKSLIKEEIKDEKIIKTQNSFNKKNSSNNLFGVNVRKKVEDFKLANNVNKYMMDSLQKEMEDLQNYGRVIAKKKNNSKKKEKLSYNWNNELIASVKKKK